MKEHPLIKNAQAEGFERFSVKVVLQHPESGRFLMIRRARNEKRAGEWDFPGGGVDCKNDGFECLVKTAQREVNEEIGDITLGDISLLETLADHVSSSGQNVRIFFVQAMSWHGSPSFPMDAEHDRMAWVEVDEMDDIWRDLKPSYKNAIKEVERNKKVEK